MKMFLELQIDFEVFVNLNMKILMLRALLI